MKAEPLHLEAAVFGFLACLASVGARQGLTRREVKHQRQVGLCGAADDSVDSANRFDAKFPAITLVSHRGIIKTIAGHDLSARQGGSHHFVKVLGARGVHQHEFCDRGKLFRLRRQEDIADLLTHVRAAGLARCHHFMPALLQILRQQAVLSAFPGSVNSLKSDEKAVLFQSVSSPW